MNHGGANLGSEDKDEDVPTIEQEASFALRDIAAGEELLEDYASFTDYTGRYPEWLQKLLGRYCPERVKFERAVAEGTWQQSIQTTAGPLAEDKGQWGLAA